MFGRKKTTREDVSSVQTQTLNDGRPRSSARPRHSVAVSSIGNHPSRNPYRANDPSRQSGLPSSRSHAQFPSTYQDPNQFAQKRSISASYVSRAPQNGLPRSNAATYSRGRSLADLAASPEKPTSRFQKLKTNITEKLDMSSYLDWPADKWMELLEYFDLMDFDELGYTFGFGLNGLHLVIRIVSAIEKARRNLMNSRSQRINTQLVGDRLNEVRQLAKKKYSIGWLDLMSLLSVCLCLYSFYNAYKLFSARKSYRMHIREDPVNSPNAILVQSPTAPQEAPPSWGRALLSMLRRLSSLLIGWPNPSTSNIPKPSQVHQLDMWDPDEVRLKIFTVYPPPQAIVLHFASLTENCLNWTLIMMTTIFQTYWMVKFYSQLVKDKAIVQSEVMHEYNTKFVYPKAFPHTKEAATMTSSAEFIRREDWMSY